MWGDNLMVTLLSQRFSVSISVITTDSARTWHADGSEFDGVVAESVWIAHRGELHYYGVIRASSLPAIDLECPLCTPNFTCALHTIRTRRDNDDADVPRPKRLRITSKQPGRPADIALAQGVVVAPSPAEQASLVGRSGRTKKGQRKQVKMCAKCGQPGHRSDGQRCPMKGKPWPQDVPVPRWKKLKGQLGSSSKRDLPRVDARKRTKMIRAKVGVANLGIVWRPTLGFLMCFL
jgi:hypothetical protein